MEILNGHKIEQKIDTKLVSGKIRAVITVTIVHTIVVTIEVNGSKRKVTRGREETQIRHLSGEMKVHGRSGSGVKDDGRNCEK